MTDQTALWLVSYTTKGAKWKIDNTIIQSIYIKSYEHSSMFKKIDIHIIYK